MIKTSCSFRAAKKWPCMLENDNERIPGIKTTRSCFTILNSTPNTILYNSDGANSKMQAAINEANKLILADFFVISKLNFSSSILISFEYCIMDILRQITQIDSEIAMPTENTPTYFNPR